MKSSIICLGNRFVDVDAVGIDVFNRLRQLQPLPSGVELIEGGMAGLNLLPLLEHGGRVVFVDAVVGFAQADEIVLLEKEEILASLSETHYGHDSGLAYLLTVLPCVCEGRMVKDIVLVGLEGSCSGQTIEQAAGWCIDIAVHGINAFNSRFSVKGLVGNYR